MLVRFGSDTLVTSCALLPEMFEQIATRYVPLLIHAGFYKLIGHDDVPSMFGLSVEEPGLLVSLRIATDLVFLLVLSSGLKM